MADVTTPFGFPYPEDTDLVRDGASDIENLAEGVNDYLNGGYLYAGTRYYTSSGTFDKADPLETGDIGLRAIRVRVVGGGGGGGGSVVPSAGRCAIGGSGGGGGYAEAFVLASSLDASETVTRGAAGSAGATSGAGGAGGTSSFGAHASATGGAAGKAGVNSAPIFAISGVAGGSGTVGDYLGTGGASASVLMLRSDFVTNSPSGGSVLSGGMPATVETATNAAGSAGTGFGVGGTGGATVAGSTAQTGGAGSTGILIVDCFV